MPELRKSTWRSLILLLPCLWLTNAMAQTLHDSGEELVIRTTPVDLPIHHGQHGHEHEGVFPPVGTVTVPVSGYIHAFNYSVVAGDDQPIPRVTLHHFNIIDPAHRELFLPISRRLLAAGQETGEQKLPWFVLGIPVTKGQELVVSAMLHNPTGTPYRDVSLEIRLRYVPDGRPWPLFDVYPFQIDVAFPAGDKSFDLPAGKFSKAWEGSPGVAGRIVGLGGHLHEYASHLTLEDVTSDELLWTGYPLYADDGSLLSVTSEVLLSKLGIPVDPSHTYRVTVHYDNPTGEVIKDGGMGLLGGVFIPEGSTQWPVADAANELYTVDRLHYLRQVRGPYEMIADAEQRSRSDTAAEDQQASHQHTPDPVEHAH